MDILEQLQFRQELNKSLRQRKTFDQLFSMSGYVIKFSQFLDGKIGQIWEKSTQGKMYKYWQGV